MQSSEMYVKEILFFLSNKNVNFSVSGTGDFIKHDSEINPNDSESPPNLIQFFSDFFLESFETWKKIQKIWRKKKEKKKFHGRQKIIFFWKHFFLIIFWIFVLHDILSFQSYINSVYSGGQEFQSLDLYPSSGAGKPSSADSWPSPPILSWNVSIIFEVKPKPNPVISIITMYYAKHFKTNLMPIIIFQKISFHNWLNLKIKISLEKSNSKIVFTYIWN